MKEIPLAPQGVLWRNGLKTKVDADTHASDRRDEDYEWLSRYSWYAYYDSFSETLRFTGKPFSGAIRKFVIWHLSLVIFFV